jgi:quinol monooxygenase YgiN
MLIHSVYFWLKDDLSKQAVDEFEKALESLFEDTAVESGSYGKPAGTPPRAVLENSYSYGLVLNFADQAAHDRYQEGPLHKRFLAQNRAKWEQSVVYDIEA